jgi:hypothetical protein
MSIRWSAFIQMSLEDKRSKGTNDHLCKGLVPFMEGWLW